MASLDNTRPAELELTSNLCEFVGALIGDGHIMKNYKGKNFYGVLFTGNSELDKDYFLQKLSPIATSISSTKPCITFRKEKKAIMMRFYSKKLYQELVENIGLPTGNKTFTIKIPEKIIKSNDELIFATMRGIFDTDGTVFLDKRKIYKSPYPRISLQTVSKPLFDQLKARLEKHFSLYTNYFAKRKVFVIEIYGKSQLDKWMQLIGFSNNRHLNKIKELQAGIAPATSASLGEIARTISNSNTNAAQ